MTFQLVRTPTYSMPIMSKLGFEMTWRSVIFT